MARSEMLTLGIETSCDETSCAVLEGKDRIRSNIVSSSLLRHQPFGGVVPEIASRHCLEQIDFVFQTALAQAKVKPEDLDLIAVTEGPGLIGSLLVGVCFAKALGYQLKIPLVPVNHLEAHLDAAFISNGGAFAPPETVKRPRRFLGLLVSGGHTSLSLHQGDKVTLMGETVDDAVGEAYDKVAKILGLGYPGGPIMDRLAKEGDPETIRFTKPKQENPYNFSFSGIKTAALYYVREQKLDQRSEKEIAQIQKNVAASFQKSVVQWLVEKTIRVASEKKVESIAVGGGVSANSHLRQALVQEASRLGFKVLLPHLSLTNDNAAMIARRGVEIFKKGKSKKSYLKLSGNANLRLK